MAGQQLHHFTNAAHVIVTGAEVPRAGKALALLVQAGRQLQVTGQRLQGVLPGAHCLGETQGHRLTGGPRLEHIGDQPLGRKVAAAEHIAGTRSGQAQAMLGMALGRKERRGIGLREDLAASLATAVRVVPAQRFVLTVGPSPFLVGVHLVGGDHHAGTNATDLAHRFEQVESAHDIGRIGAQRIAVAFAYQGLGRQVQDDFRLHFGDQLQQHTQVAHVATAVIDAFADPRQFEQARLGRRVEGKTGDLGTQALQPKRQPAALETGVAGDQDALAGPERRAQAHCFHGASPLLHNCSRWFLSRRVSIGCQKPSWAKACSCPSLARRDSGSASHEVASPSM
ncbi:hypothetical protein D9M71_340490 [compost metagenome]